MGRKWGDERGRAEGSCEGGRTREGRGELSNAYWEQGKGTRQPCLHIMKHADRGSNGLYGALTSISGIAIVYEY